MNILLSLSYNLPVTSAIITLLTLYYIWEQNSCMLNTYVRTTYIPLASLSLMFLRVWHEKPHCPHLVPCENVFHLHSAATQIHERCSHNRNNLFSFDLEIHFTTKLPQKIILSILKVSTTKNRFKNCLPVAEQIHSLGRLMVFVLIFIFRGIRSTVGRPITEMWRFSALRLELYSFSGAFLSRQVKKCH